MTRNCQPPSDHFWHGLRKNWTLTVTGSKRWSKDSLRKKVEIWPWSPISLGGAGRKYSPFTRGVSTFRNNNKRNSNRNASTSIKLRLKGFSAWPLDHRSKMQRNRGPLKSTLQTRRSGSRKRKERWRRKEWGRRWRSSANAPSRLTWWLSTTSRTAGWSTARRWKTGCFEVWRDFSKSTKIIDYYFFEFFTHRASSHWI